MIFFFLLINGGFMAFVITKDEGIFKEFLFDFNKGELKKAYEEILKELKNHAEVDGFRKGHAPEWIVKSKFKKYILEDLVEKFSHEAYKEAKGLGFDVLDVRVNLEKSSFSEKDMTLKMEGYIEVFPIIEADKLEDLTNVELEVPKREVTEEFIELSIKNLLEDRATLEPKDEPIEPDDYIVIDYTVTDRKDGEAITQKLDGILKEFGFRKDLYETILGKKAKDKAGLENVSLREGQENEAYVDIEVEIQEVKKKVYPELTDELAKELGIGETKEEALDKIRKQAEEYIDYKKQQDKDKALTDFLLEKYRELTKVSKSEALRIAELIYEEEMARLQSMFNLEGVSDEVLEKISKSAYEKALEEGAVSSITRSILVSYAKKFGLDVTQEDIDKHIEEQVEIYKNNLPPEKQTEEGLKKLKESIEAYFSREDKKSTLIKDILASKAMDKLVEMVKFKEVETTKEENVE